MRVTISSPSALNLSLGRFKLEDEKQAVTILKPGICIQPEGWPQLPQRQIWVFLGLSIGWEKCISNGACAHQTQAFRRFLHVGKGMMEIYVFGHFEARKLPSVILPKWKKNKKVFLVLILKVEYMYYILNILIWRALLAFLFFPYKDYVRKLRDFLWIWSPAQKVGCTISTKCAIMAPWTSKDLLRRCLDPQKHILKHLVFGGIWRILWCFRKISHESVSQVRLPLLWSDPFTSLDDMWWMCYVVLPNG